MNNPLVSIIIINYQQAQITCDLLDSLCDIHYTHYELLLVDNGLLKDSTARYQRHHPHVKVINSKENRGFAGGNNLAIKQAKGDYILLLNNDTIVPANFLNPMVQLMEDQAKTGIVSPKIYFYDAPNTLQYAGTSVLSFKTGRGVDPAKNTVDHGQYDQLKKVPIAHGACMLIRKAVLEDIGLLSEAYFLYYEELDFCERARQNGWDIYFTPDSYIHHLESSSVGKFSPLKTHYMFRNRWIFIRKFGGKNYWSFLAYFWLISIPLNVFRFSKNREWKHLRALWDAILWNLSKKENRTQKSINY